MSRVIQPENSFVLRNQKWQSAHLGPTALSAQSPRFSNVSRIDKETLPCRHHARVFEFVGVGKMEKMEVTQLIWEHSLALTLSRSPLLSSQLEQLLLTNRQFPHHGQETCARLLRG
jgi:hypothetical protein